jgi:F420-dependent oxidoreductase-like protein
MVGDRDARGALPSPTTFRFGLHSGPQHTDLAGYEQLWTRAEDLGLDWVSVFDHFVPIYSDPTGPCFEGPTLLAAMAAKTERVRCGILVVGNTYRHPAVLANIGATLDHVAEGRLELGLGAGWYEREHDQYGLPFPSLGERLRRLREAAHVVAGLWTQEETSYEGRYYTLTAARCEPKPIQRPRPALWIGGAGERVLLRIVAECADGWNTFLIPEDDYRRKCETLQRHCADVGRDPTEIRRSIVFQAVLGETEAEAEEQLRERAALDGIEPDALRASGLVPMTPEQCVEMLAPSIRLGARDLIMRARPPADERTFELLARAVAPAVRSAW